MTINIKKNKQTYKIAWIFWRNIIKKILIKLS